MRVFIAVEISQEVREAVASRISFLRASFPDLRVGWEKPEKLHLTVKFLGEIDETRLQDLIAATEKAARGVQPFELSIENVGAFPPYGASRVLWLGATDAGGSFREFYQKLENECFEIGFKRETRGFHPHLTVARLKEPRNCGKLARLHLNTNFPAASFAVNRITVFQSKLSPQGSSYEVQAQVKLP